MTPTSRSTFIRLALQLTCCLVGSRRSGGHAAESCEGKEWTCIFTMATVVLLLLLLLLLLLDFNCHYWSL